MYSDGAINYNDPSDEVYTEIQQKEGKTRPVKLVLTLGTGQRPTKTEKAASLLLRSKHVKKFTRQVRRLVHDLVNSEQIERSMRLRAENDDFEYFKWTGGTEIGGLHLDVCEPEKLEQMGRWAAAYMEQDEIQTQLSKVAELLVMTRRNRAAADPDRWSRFAWCTKIPCAYCPQREDWLRTRAEAKQHLIAEHQNQISNILDIDRYVADMPFIYAWERGPFTQRI